MTDFDDDVARTLLDAQRDDRVTLTLADGTRYTGEVESNTVRDDFYGTGREKGHLTLQTVEPSKDTGVWSCQVVLKPKGMHGMTDKNVPSDDADEPKWRTPKLKMLSGKGTPDIDGQRVADADLHRHQAVQGDGDA